MAWRELKENGIDPYRDFKELRFEDTHDRVVYAVRDRMIDAGTVRTNTLEDLSAEGKIDLTDFYVYPRLHDKDARTPYFCTTREYPEWPLAKIRHTPDRLAEKVAVALQQMPPDSSVAKAAGCAGWTIPLNYQPVHDCLKVLKAGPYKDLGRISFPDVLRSYGHWIFFACAAFCILEAFTGVVLKLNRKIRSSHVRLMIEMDLHKQKDRPGIKHLQTAGNDDGRRYWGGNRVGKRQHFFLYGAHEPTVSQTGQSGSPVSHALAVGSEPQEFVEIYCAGSR